MIVKRSLECWGQGRRALREADWMNFLFVPREGEEVGDGVPF